MQWLEKTILNFPHKIMLGICRSVRRDPGSQVLDDPNFTGNKGSKVLE